MYDTTEHNGRRYRVTLEPDEIGRGAPWEEEDGHGPVSKWTTRAKRPGEVILAQDRSSYRYYDMSEAIKTARADGWGFLPYPLVTERNPDGQWFARVHGPRFSLVILAPDVNEAISALYAAWRATFPTARAYHAAAAQADYERLKAWCDDQWYYVGVVVQAECPCCGSAMGETAALWGIESDVGDYLEEAAQELIEELSETETCCEELG